MRDAGEQPDAPPLASLLARYMAERGLGQRQLADRAGVSAATLNRWLNGRSERPYHRGGLLMVAAALGLPRVSTNRLLRAAGFPPLDALARSPSAEERALLERWSLPTRNTLPAGLTSFVGRSDEVAGVAELLCREDVRLVSLTGAGGCGKTRLAIRAAGEVLDAFPDGVFFVPLVAVTDPRLVLETVAGALGLRDVRDASPHAHLVGWLGARRVLLLLDNLEQVVACGPQVVGLLREAPGLTVLATSRVPLHVSGEYAWPVEPFPLPGPDRPRRALLANPAVALFLERAHAANPRRVLDDDEELAAVAELCARLDGLPLAIELAAARTRDRGPERLLAEFAGRLDLGSAGPRDVVPRQQTLRDAIAWSLDLLPAPARTLLLRLSVFAGGWSEPAAAAVCAPGGAPDGTAQQLLTTLVDASLVVRVAPDGAAGRYRMLQTIREYASELLAGEEAEIRERHARYFLALAESAPPYVPEVREGDWYARVEEDLDNVRAALAWAAEREDPEVLARLCAALWPYWHEYFRVGEGRRWLDVVLPRRAALPLHLRAGILTGACTLGFTQTDYRTAIDCGEEALDLWRELDDHRGQALVLQQLGWALVSSGDLAAALAALEAMFEQWRQVGDARGIACALCDLGLAATSMGDLAAGASYLSLAEETYRAVGPAEGLGRLRREQGLHALLAGDVPRAVSLLREAVERLGARDRTYVLLMATFFLGTALYQTGELDEAIAVYTDSLRLHQEIGDQGGLVLTLLGFAAVAHRRGDGTRAAVLCGAADALRAAVLCGAADALRAAHHTVLQPVIQAIYEREVGMVKDLIGPEAFAEGFARGTEMTTAEALAYAREAARGT